MGVWGGGQGVAGGGGGGVLLYLFRVKTQLWSGMGVVERVRFDDVTRGTAGLPAVTRQPRRLEDGGETWPCLGTFLGPVALTGPPRRLTTPPTTEGRLCGTLWPVGP